MSKKILSYPYILWIIGFIVLPLFTIIYYAFTNDGVFTFENIAAIAEPIHRNALLLSLELALISTLICLLIAYPLALILSKKSHGRKSFVVFLFIMPMWMNYLLRVIALKTLLDDNGVLNSVLSSLGLPGFRVIGTSTAIVIGMVYDYLPFMILPIYNSLSRLDRGLIEAAGDLGANGMTTLRRVIFPLSLPGVISGITMVFIPAISEFVIADILGGGKVLLIGNVIEQEFTFSFNWPLGSGLSLVLMAFVMITILITNRFDKSGEGATLL